MPTTDRQTRAPAQHGPRHPGAVVLVLALLLPAAVRAAESAPRTAAPDTVPPAARTLDGPAWDRLHLARAVALWHQDRTRDARAELESIDLDGGATDGVAAQAAFLLAVICRGQGDHRGLADLARRAGDPGAASPWRRWVAYLALLDQAAPDTTAAAADLPGAPELAASLLLTHGRPGAARALLAGDDAPQALAAVRLYLRALAAEAAGDPAGSDADWRRLARLAPDTPADADLVGAAALHLAARAGADTDAAAEWLRRVPRNARQAVRARHARGLLALAGGDTARGVAELSAGLDGTDDGAERRAILLDLGAVAASRGAWASALARYDAADSSWQAGAADLTALAAPDSAAAAWRFWSRDARTPDAIVLDGELVQDALAAAVAEAVHGEPARPGGPAAPLAAPSALVRAARAHRPTPAQWDTVRTAVARQEHARVLLGDLDHAIAVRRDDLARRREFLNTGQDGADASERRLAAAVMHADSLLARLDAAAAALDTLRDRALLRFARRAAGLTTELRRNLLFAQAVQHFRVGGPIPPGADTPPPDFPAPADLLRQEMLLDHEIGDFLERFADRTPDLVRRSAAEIWLPRLLGDTPDLRDALARQRTRAAAAADSLARLRNALDHDPVLAALTAQRADQARRTAAAAAAVGAVRRTLAADVAARGRAQLAAAREAIDYHRADAAYWQTVAAATDTADTAAAAATVARARALDRLRTFLDRYPASAARSETRFRLADLELLRARDDFRTRMASFLQHEPDGADLQDRALAPFVDHGPATAQYRAILAEDPSFAHTDAVLFNLGMILADDGQAEGEDLLTRLVTDFPAAPRVQEAWLRLGDLKFARNENDAARPCFEHAAAAGPGRDPGLAAIALYKLGWTHLREDRFLSAADAFARLLDLAGAGAVRGGGDGSTDLAAEAEDHLVHALIRAGGAPAFASFFAERGGRPWEARILADMGRTLRGFSLYADAAACDRLRLARYPLAPDALAAAERLADTFLRWDRPDSARASRLAEAPRFTADSPWAAANPDTVLRARGVAFAQSATRDAAEHEHRRARDGAGDQSWRRALDLYAVYLERWPDAADAARIHAQAGEAAARLEAYPVALEHFGTAAARGDSARDGRTFVADAAWQVVAVTDAWYRSTRADTTAPGAVGADSLAAALLAAGDRFAAAHPDDPRVPDLRWRQGNLAYAHGWNDDAAARLQRFGRRQHDDPRAAQALRLAGDAHTRARRFGSAAATYEEALAAARAANDDSLATRLAAAVPLSWYRLAESVADADTVTGAAAAADTFAMVARRWPDYPHADTALYRAGLGYAAGGDAAGAAAAWDRLLRDHAGSPLARDAAMQAARVLEDRDPAAAAAAYERFAELFTRDPDAAEALLRAADLRASGGDDAGAEGVRSLYLDRFPDDWRMALEIRGRRAAAALQRIDAGDQALDQAPELAAYLVLAADHPGQGDPHLLAHADFLKAEAARSAYEALPLDQPLPAAIARKQAGLEQVLALYRACLDRGDLEYGRAAAHRLGAEVVHFGDALQASERPADLAGDDLQAYEDVLADQAWVFQEKGEAAWTDLLRQCRNADADPGGWLARTREALWPRLARRFLHRPEVAYPRVAAAPPATATDATPAATARTLP